MPNTVANGKPAPKDAKKAEGGTNMPAKDTSNEAGKGGSVKQETKRGPDGKKKWGRINTRELLPNQVSTPAQANGVLNPGVGAVRKESLIVPGQPGAREGSEDGRDSPHSQRGERLSQGSRRESSRSLDSRSVDYSKYQNAHLPQNNDDVEEKPKSMVADDSWIRSAIPYLPRSAAAMCLVMNVLIPGSGTILSGFCIFCCGKPRIQSKDDHLMSTFCVNAWVGTAQFFTVSFMLVGWFWSLTWGIYMVILAVEYKKEQKQKREKELQAMALTAFGSPVRPFNLRT